MIRGSFFFGFHIRRKRLLPFSAEAARAIQASPGIRAHARQQRRRRRTRCIEIESTSIMRLTGRANWILTLSICRPGVSLSSLFLYALCYIHRTTTLSSPPDSLSLTGGDCVHCNESHSRSTAILSSYLWRGNYPSSFSRARHTTTTTPPWCILGCNIQQHTVYTYAIFQFLYITYTLYSIYSIRRHISFQYILLKCDSSNIILHSYIGINFLKMIYDGIVKVYSYHQWLNLFLTSASYHEWWS